MEKKKIILELSSELIDKLDRFNNLGDRSDFISHLIEKQLKTFESNNLTESNGLITKMSNNAGLFGANGEINLLNWKGDSLGIFNIDTLEGFEDLTKKIQEISKDPAVQIRARSLF